MKVRIPAVLSLNKGDPVTDPRGTTMVGVTRGRANPVGAEAGGKAGRPPVSSTPIDARLNLLAAQVEHKEGVGSSSARRVLLACGVSAMGLGVVAVVLGWFGAAHSPYLFQEVPYLISGGLLGAALVGVGAAMFLAAWVLRCLEAINRQSATLSNLISRAAESNGKRRTPGEARDADVVLEGTGARMVDAS